MSFVFVHTKSQFKPLIIILFVMNCSLITHGQEEQKSKKFSLFYVPTSSWGGELWIDINSYWFDYGFSYQLKNKHQLAVRHGFVLSSKNTAGGLFGNLTSSSQKGYAIHAEHQYKFTDNWFYATEIYTQQTTTKREEQVNGSAVYRTYKVDRQSFGLLSKIGYHKNWKFHFFSEIAVGAGLRYISSASFDKLNPQINLQQEYFSKKIFDQGEKFAQRIVFQIKLGYCF